LKCFFFALAIFVLFISQTNSKGIPVPDNFHGQIKVEDTISGFHWTGWYSKQLKPSGDWFLAGEIISVDAEREFSWEEEHYLYQGGKENYIIKDKAGEESGCVPPADVPPLEGLKEAFENAKVINDPSILVPEIPDCEGTLWEIGFTGLSYLLCVQVDHVVVYGEGFIARLTIEEGGSQETAMKVDQNCQTSHHTRTDVAKGSEEPWFYLHNVPKYEATKDCFFIHGAGVLPDDFKTANVGGIGSKEYWGNMEKFTPQCATRHFIHMDTTNRGWDNPATMDEVCDFISQGSGNTIISNAVIFSHSMGNLIVAAAIHNGVCDIDDSSSWYNSQGPMLGSRAAKYVTEGCQDPLSAVRIGAAATGWWCDPNNNWEAYPSYQSMDPPIEDLEHVIQNKMKGALCGSDSWGLHTLHAPALALIDLITGFGEKNDGMVAVSDCTYTHESKFSTSDHKKLFYKPIVNHADGTCQNGDGWWGSDRKPCSWFKGKS